MGRRKKQDGEPVPPTDTGKFFKAIGRMNPGIFLTMMAQRNHGDIEALEIFTKQWLKETDVVKKAEEEDIQRIVNAVRTHIFQDQVWQESFQKMLMGHNEEPFSTMVGIIQQKTEAHFAYLFSIIALKDEPVPKKEEK